MLMVRKILYYTMLWLRPVFLLTSRWIQVVVTGIFAFMLGMKLIVDGSPITWLDVGILAGLAFGIFMLRESYDSLLLKLNPTDSELILFK
jgi:hypothetical protein